MRRRYFTWIELLVVLILLCVLGAVLILPALSRARESALRINCASNLKGMGIALSMFANERAEKFPYEVSSRDLGLTGETVGETRTFAVGGREDMFLNVVSGVGETPARISAGGSARRNLSGGLPDRRVNQWFFNVLYGSANPDGTELVGGKGVAPDARLYICPSSKTSMTVPKETALLPDILPYGSNFAMCGAMSVPNIITVGDRCRPPDGSEIGDDMEPGAAGGRNHNGDGFNFGYKDGHVKWCRGPSGETAVRLTVDESSDAGNILVPDGAEKTVEDIVFF